MFKVYALFSIYYQSMFATIRRPSHFAFLHIIMFLINLPLHLSLYTCIWHLYGIIMFLNWEMTGHFFVKGKMGWFFKSPWFNRIVRFEYADVAQQVQVQAASAIVAHELWNISSIRGVSLRECEYICSLTKLTNINMQEWPGESLLYHL